MCVYIYKHNNVYVSRTLYIYIYIHVFMCIYVYHFWCLQGRSFKDLPWLQLRTFHLWKSVAFRVQGLEAWAPTASLSVKFGIDGCLEIWD